MENKEPDSRLSVRKGDLEDQELYRLNQIINDLYSKVSTARDETADAVKGFSRSGVLKSASDQSAPSIPPVAPDDGLPQAPATDWSFNPIVYSAGEDGQQYGFVSITVTNKPPTIDYYSLFIQDYSAGYVNTSGTAVTLTSAAKSAGTTFENCVAGQVININSVAYTIAATPTAPYETLTLTSSAGTQANVYFNLNPVDGAWQEIAPNAETGEWLLRPPPGLDIPACITASTKQEKTYKPPDGTNYKRLVFAPWGDAPQLSAFTVNVETKTQAGVPSGRFVVNFTRPLDPEYYYSSIERLWYVNNTFTGNIGATAMVDVSGTTVTYNPAPPPYDLSFKGQYFNYLQPGDTVYISAGPTLSETNTYTIAEVISNTELKLTTAPPAGAGQVFAQWIRIAAEANSFRQNDYWPLPTNAEYWKFRARSVNHRERANNTAPPTENVTVPNSSGITQVAPGVITAAAFASTIRPVDLITTAGVSLTSVVVAAGGVATVTTSSAHGLATGRQVAIYGGLGNAAKLNGLYAITNTGANTFTITTSGVPAGTYTVGLFEAPLPALPSATYPNGAVAFLTANTRLYRSSGSAWTAATDGGDIVANSITAGQIAAGAISTTELFAGEILVGQGGGKPTLFKVVDSGGNMIGFIGDISTPTYPVSFNGGYFQNLLIAPTLSLTSTPRIYATSAGTMELVGVTIQATNIGTGGFDPGTVTISPGNLYGAVQVTSSSLGSLSAIGPNYVTVRSNNPANWYPFCEIYRTSSRAIVRGFADPFFNSFFEFSIDATPANSYANFKSVPIQINSTTVIDSSRNGSFANLALTGTLTAGGSVGTSGQVLISTGTGVQWSSAGGSGVASITGTTNQVIASSPTGAVTLSLPQDIATSSAVTFGSVNTTTVGPTTLTGLNFRTDNANRWSISSTGMLIPAASDTYDIGVLATSRVRAVYTRALDTAQSGSTGDYVQTRKLQLFDNTGAISAPGFWDLNAEVSGVGVGSNSYFYIRDNAGNKVLQSERLRFGVSVSRTLWYTDLLPDTNFGRSIGSSSLKWQLIYANQIGDSLNTVVINGGVSTFSQVETGSFRFTISPAAGAFLKSDASGFASWSDITSQLSAGTGISISGTTTATISIGQAVGTSSSVTFGNVTSSGYFNGSSTSSYYDTSYNSAGAPYRLRGSSLVDNGGVWVSAGGVNMNAGCAATGYNIFGGGTGQTVTVNFSGGFTIGASTYNNLVFTGGVLTSYS